MVAEALLVLPVAVEQQLVALFPAFLEQGEEPAVRGFSRLSGFPVSGGASSIRAFALA